MESKDKVLSLSNFTRYSVIVKIISFSCTYGPIRLSAIIWKSFLYKTKHYIIVLHRPNSYVRKLSFLFSCNFFLLRWKPFLWKIHYLHLHFATFPFYAVRHDFVHQINVSVITHQIVIRKLEKFKELYQDSDKHLRVCTREFAVQYNEKWRYRVCERRMKSVWRGSHSQWDSRA